MKSRRMTASELAEEARKWDSGELTPAVLVDAPEAAPRIGESTAISIRLPTKMLALLKEFARREGLGYQVLMKRWLDDRLRIEWERRRAKRPKTRVARS
jgi:hypothetical protein